MRSCNRCGREYGALVTFCSDDGQLLDTFDVSALCGQVFDGRYRLEERLGEGAHGVVFRATQLDIDREVAIKILHPAKVLHPAVLAETMDIRDYWLSCVVRFQREAKAAGRLRHPNIVAVTDFGRADGDIIYIVMEYLMGPSLRRIIKARGTIQIPVAVRLMHQVCWAVEAAHRQGVIHRDLKPANIVVESIDGIGEVAKILDFGIAKLTEIADDDLTNMTDTGVFLGTPKYMSPEQCAGSALDARSDVYSLGMVLYEMLTGELPFHGTAIAVALQHATTPPRSPRLLAPDIPEAVERVILKAVEKDPNRRHGSAAELALDLERSAVAAGVAHAFEYARIDMTGVGEEDTSRLGSPARVDPTVDAPIAGRRSRIEIDLEPARVTESLESSPTPAPIETAVVASGESLVTTRVRAPLPAPPEGMVLVPAGRFLMGSERGLANERPVHEVALDAFFVDVTEVTNAQYRLFCDRTKRQYPPNPRWNPTYFLGNPNHPVVNVSWADAEAFAKWVGKRLPTEAEWEKAARGGLEGCEYPWGNEIGPTQAQYETAGTCSTRTFPPNGYGIHEIVGNVWEWCADWYDANAYRRGACANPLGPTSGAEKVLRGGSIDGTFLTLRIAYRHWMPPSRRSSDIGFRCAKGIS